MRSLQVWFRGRLSPGYLSLLRLMSPPVLDACPRLENIPGSHLSWLRSLLTSSTVIRGSSLLSPRALQWLTSRHSYRECHTQHHGFRPCPLSRHLRGTAWSRCRLTREVQLHLPSVSFRWAKSRKVATPVSRTPIGIFPSTTPKPLTYWCQRPRHRRGCSEFLPR